MRGTVGFVGNNVHDKKPEGRGARPAEDMDEAIISLSVARALQRWSVATGNDGSVFIGEIALAFYARPRFVDHLDFLYFVAAAVPKSVSGFRQLSANEFADICTKSVVNAMSFDCSWLTPGLVVKVHHTAVSKAEMSIASLHGMIALKLYKGLADRLGGRRDQQDVIDMIRWKPDLKPQEMDWWELDEPYRATLLDLHDMARLED